MSTDSLQRRATKNTSGRRTRKTNTKRRDGDAVRVYPTGRLCFWTGGIPGSGKRLFERYETVEDAEARAAALREKFARQHIAAPKSLTTLDEVFQSMLNQLRADNQAPGTVKQYKSNWNKWVPDTVGQTRCIDVDMETWTAVFDYASANGATKATIASIQRTMNRFISWTFDRRYFPTAEPFGPARWRSDLVRRKRANAPTKTGGGPILFKHCPTVPDIQQFAAAVEEVYPGYGNRLVMLGFASGLRVNELLALRVEHIDLTTGVIDVAWQLDSNMRWPAVRLPKNGKSRKALLWTAMLPVAESLVADTLARGDDADPERGWLFPRHRSTSGWARQAGALITEAIESCEWSWTFHWLRHAYASYSLAPKSEGGYGLNVVSVQHWLGHSKLSITQDMYVERIKGDTERAFQTTARMPGLPSDTE